VSVEPTVGDVWLLLSQGVVTSDSKVNAQTRHTLKNWFNRITHLIRNIFNHGSQGYP